MLAAAGSNSCLEATYNLLRENPAAACFRNTGRGESGSSAAATRKRQCARKRERGGGGLTFRGFVKRKRVEASIV